MLAEPPTGDELTTALIPVADRLISAVHAVDPDAVAAAIDEATALAGSLLGAWQHLAMLLAAWCSEDHGAVAALGWTLDPEVYRAECGHADALTASLRTARAVTGGMVPEVTRE